MQSTQRVESINALIHKAVSASSSMANVVEVLDSRMQQEAINKSFMAWKYKSITHQQPFIVENFFNNINNIIKKYFSPRIIEAIHTQMCESVLYKCEKVPNEEAFEFIEDQLDEVLFADNQDNEGITKIEDHYDYQQAYLKTLMNSVSKELICEVWRIVPYMTTSSYQHIVLLKDGTHLCTCLLLVLHGIICRHYFKLMVENSNALFHIKMMPTRWFRDDVWNKVDLASSEPFVGASSKGFKKSQTGILQNTYPIPKHYNNVQESQVHQHTHSKMYYGQLMGQFKKALNYSLEDNDQKTLNDLILSYISEKEAKRKIDMQSRQEILKENTDLNYEIELSNSHVYNADNVKDLVKHRGKGRPPNKRIKAYNEKNRVGNQKENKHESNNNIADNDNSSGRKCDLCHNIGHYAPKCPTKNSEC
ncbi:2647_t:CDS:2 [Scutellospora calospora]|uniref:2647_t:CDS:1 n=1 Tax=Scutellospora calospora TaxID=85575 RepID=A0ACA9MRX7_9GLOM|nr:2647_t:CDS:2 [Scutellospora calospora]